MKRSNTTCSTLILAGVFRGRHAHFAAGKRSVLHKTRVLANSLRALEPGRICTPTNQSNERQSEDHGQKEDEKREQKSRQEESPLLGAPLSDTPSAEGEQTSFRFATGDTMASIKKSIRNHLHFTLARHEDNASPTEWWTATSLAVRDRLLNHFMRTQKAHHNAKTRRAYYLSLEYLMGRVLLNNLHNAGIYEAARDALRELGQDVDLLAEEEDDMGLGNGGLGRLAACFLDSLATLDLPSVGYGIHYEFGLFRQAFEDGHQIENPDAWMLKGCPWEIMRPNYTQHIKLYGRVEHQMDSKGDFKPVWADYKTLEGVPFDIPIVGYGGDTVNFLRLWESRASQQFDLSVFNEGGYIEALREKAMGKELRLVQQTISKVLYPNDKTESGKELRLVQQYFFVSCSLQDIIRRFKGSHDGWEKFPEYNVVQLNDTHPAIAVPELMRLLLDEHGLGWDEAWDIVTQTFNYTNHTLLPEALEKWSVPLFEKVLPRHLQIIFEINTRFLSHDVENCWPGDGERRRCSRSSKRAIRRWSAWPICPW